MALVYKGVTSYFRTQKASLLREIAQLDEHVPKQCFGSICFLHIIGRCVLHSRRESDTGKNIVSYGR